MCAKEFLCGVSKHLAGTAVGQNNASRVVDTNDRLGSRFQESDQQLFGFVEDPWDIRGPNVVGWGMVGIVDHGRSFRDPAV